MMDNVMADEDDARNPVVGFGRPPMLNAKAKGFVVDEVSATMYLTDAPADLVPGQVYGDGNCLFRSASVFFFAKQDEHKDLRRRTAKDLLDNRQFYANFHVARARQSASDSNLPQGGEKYDRHDLGRSSERQEFQKVLRSSRSPGIRIS